MIRHFRVILAHGALLPLAVAPSRLTTQGPGAPLFVVDTVARGFEVPKAIAVLSASEMLVASHRYSLSRLSLTDGARTMLSGGPAAVPIRSPTAETAILDLLPHPDFQRTGSVFLSVAVGDSTRTTVAVMRGRIVGSRLVDTTTLLVAAAWDTSEAHYGGSLALRDGFLFVSIGEREDRASVQNLESHKGKILRLHDDGRVPADNPFVSGPRARPEIWTYGHRNPQGLAFDSSGVLWANEHGPRHGDELNRIERGRDYGWPRVSFGWEYRGGAIGAGVPADSLSAAPLWVWTPAIAPSDLLIYSGRAFPGWQGNFFSTSLNARRHLNRLVWDGRRFTVEERLLSGELGRLRSMAVSPEGWLFLGNDAGLLLRVRPRAE